MHLNLKDSVNPVNRSTQGDISNHHISENEVDRHSELTLQRQFTPTSMMDTETWSRHAHPQHEN